MPSRSPSDPFTLEWPTDLRTVMRLQLGFLALVASLAAAPASAAVTAFRFSDLDLRDPHVFFSFIGCRDVTDTPLVGYSFNGSTQQQIQSDSDPDGRLDLSYLLLFDELDPGAPSGTIRFGTADCDTPMTGTACSPGSGVFTTATYVNGGSPCLGTLAGTTRPYAPAITSSSAPCFVTSTIGALTLNLGGIPITLRDAQIAATYVGASPTNLANGLIRGFLTEADANNTIIPATYPLFGGQPLSALLPGGDPPGPNACCAPYSDKDVNAGVSGWWFYLNFVAVRVPWSETVSVNEPAGDLVVASAYPNPFRPALTIRYALPRVSEVEITIHDAQGRRIAGVEHGVREAGSHTATWNAREAGGAAREPGIYFVRLDVNGTITTRRVALLR